MKILLCDSQSRQEVEAKLINVLQICENVSYKNLDESTCGM